MNTFESSFGPLPAVMLAVLGLASFVMLGLISACGYASHISLALLLAPLPFTAAGLFWLILWKRSLATRA